MVDVGDDREVADVLHGGSGVQHSILTRPAGSTLCRGEPLVSRRGPPITIRSSRGRPKKSPRPFSSTRQAALKRKRRSARASSGLRRSSLSRSASGQTSDQRDLAVHEGEKELVGDPSGRFPLREHVVARALSGEALRNREERGEALFEELAGRPGRVLWVGDLEAHAARVEHAGVARVGHLANGREHSQDLLAQPGLRLEHAQARSRPSTPCIARRAAPTTPESPPSSASRNEQSTKA